VVVDRAQVLVVEVVLEHREEALEPLRIEGAPVLVGERPQPFERVGEQLEDAQRLVQ
jgi:hypothetical protein